MTEIGRNLLIKKNAVHYLRDRLFNVRGFTTEEIEIDEAFDYKRWGAAGAPGAVELTKNVLSLGFTFDDGGTQAEMGSTLTLRIVTLEVFIFAISDDWGETLGGAIQQQIRADQVIPLLDLGSSDDPAVIDYLQLPDRGSVRMERVPVRDPRPWEENLFRVVAKVEDLSYAES